MKSDEWTEKFAEQLYQEIAQKKVYITNLAKCTQADARPLKDKVFKDYLAYTLEELAILQPKHIITFGNQVSSILLGKPIKVSDYKNKEHELLDMYSKPSNIPSFHLSTSPSSQHKVYPVFYPVGQGMRNMPKAIERIKSIIDD